MNTMMLWIGISASFILVSTLIGLWIQARVQIKTLRKKYESILESIILLLEKIVEGKAQLKTEKTVQSIENLRINHNFKLNVQDLFEPASIVNERSAIADKGEPSLALNTQFYQDFQFYRVTLKNLISSIILKISNSSEPISSELFNISNNISKFFENAKSYEADLKGHKGLREIEQKETEFTQNNASFIKHIEEMSDFIKKNMDHLNQVTSQIKDQAMKINEISETIRVLSINSSIEAVRAGKEGKAFNIIAGEIRKLSDNTRKFVGEINNTINLSQESVQNIVERCSSNQKVLIEKINIQNTSHKEFKGNLTHFFQRYEDISSIIYGFIESINDQIRRISPVVQLHEITIQEIENMQKVIMDFFNKNMLSLKNAEPALADELDTIKGLMLVKEVRKRLTSSHELDALQETLREFKLESHIDLDRTQKEIEFF
jgi:methyl-accepting chemotaxis protein